MAKMMLSPQQQVEGRRQAYAEAASVLEEQLGYAAFRALDRYLDARDGFNRVWAQHAAGTLEAVEYDPDED